MNEHSEYYELAKSKWEEYKESGPGHGWNAAMLRAIVRAGRITAAEFTEITGLNY